MIEIIEDQLDQERATDEGMPERQTYISERDPSYALPAFTPGGVVITTDHFRVVMDYKPGLENQENGSRFFIEPLTDEAERMLDMAASAHHVPNFNERDVRVGDQTSVRKSLRTDFVKENLPSLLAGQVEIPEEGADTIPPPDRMEACLRDHPDRYTFSE